MSITLHFSPGSPVSACFKMSNTFNVLLPYILSYSQKQQCYGKKRWNITFWVILFWSMRSSHVPELWEQWPNITAALSEEKAKAWGWSSGIRPEPPEAREQLKPKFFSPFLFFFSKKPEAVNYNETRSLLGIATSAAATNPWCYYSKEERERRRGVVLPLHLPLQRSRRSNASLTTCCSWHLRQSVKSLRRKMWTANWTHEAPPASRWVQKMSECEQQQRHNNTHGTQPRPRHPRWRPVHFSWVSYAAQNTQKVFRFLVASTLCEPIDRAL